MSRQADFRNFCQDNGDLNDEKDYAWESFRRAELGLPWGEEAQGECPVCGKRSVTTSDGRWFCYYGHKGDDGVPLTEEQQAAERILRREKQARNRERALKIWNEQCVRITSSNAMVHTYFGARGLSLEVLPDLDGVMRWHPKCPFGPRTFLPCLVSLFRDARTDKETAIHRTHITDASRGTKDEPMALGPFYGSAIKLWPLASGLGTLTIGEGIETVLAAVRLGVGETPAWAATVAGNLSQIPVIPGVERLIIASDHDAKKGPDIKTGQEHANILRRKWLDQGREVVVKIPREVGKDFNDVLIRIRRGRS